MPMLISSTTPTPIAPISSASLRAGANASILGHLDHHGGVALGQPAVDADHRARLVVGVQALPGCRATALSIPVEWITPAYGPVARILFTNRWSRPTRYAAPLVPSPWWGSTIPRLRGGFLHGGHRLRERALQRRQERVHHAGGHRGVRSGLAEGRLPAVSRVQARRRLHLRQGLPERALRGTRRVACSQAHTCGLDGNVADGGCLATTCANGVQDGNETDVDCGGDCGGLESKWCGAGQRCKTDDDCSGDVELTCAPSATPGLRVPASPRVPAPAG